MTVTVQIIRGATTYDVFQGNPYWIMSLTGSGMPPIRLIKERGAQQHGSTVTGFVLDERMINLALLIDAPDEATADGYREDLAEIFKPVDNLPLQVKLTRDDGEVRQLDTYTYGVVDFPMTNDNRFAGKQQVIAQLQAPDPIPYDPTLQNIVFTIATGAGAPGGFAVPTMIPTLSSVTTSIDDTESLVYAGKWETFPIIYLTGPANSPVITNETTGKVLDFTGSSVPGGDTWTIDLRYGAKSVRDNSGALQNAALTDESDLVDWSFVPSPTAPGGINDIHVSIPSGVTAATQVRVAFYNKYPSWG